MKSVFCEEMISIDEHGYFSRRDAKTNQIYITQRRKAPPVLHLRRDVKVEQGKKKKNLKDFERPHSGSNIANRQLGDCDPTPSGGRTHYCRNIRY